MTDDCTNKMFSRNRKLNEHYVSLKTKEAPRKRPDYLQRCWTVFKVRQTDKDDRREECIQNQDLGDPGNIQKLVPISTIHRCELPVGHLCYRLIDYDTESKCWKQAVRIFEETNEIQEKENDRGPSFVDLVANWVRTVILSDASVANASSMRITLGFVVLMVNDLTCTRTVHHESSTRHWVSRSVMTAEVYALAHGFDHPYMVRETIEKLSGRQTPLEAFLDSRSTIKVIA